MTGACSSHARSKRYAERLCDRIRKLLGRDCGVQLSDEKTRITHVRDGFDFLGFRLVLDTGQSGKFVQKIHVPRRAITRVLRRLNEVLRYRPLQESGAARIVRGSSVIRGWSNYFRIAHDYSRAANTLDHHAFWIATKSLCRKFDLSTAQCLRKYGSGARIGMSESCVLSRAQDTKMAYHLRSPVPYQPGTGCYLDDVDWEVDFQILEGRRPGRMDSKIFALFRDGYRCRKCGTTVTYENSEADHIEPVNHFASFEQANIPTNLQILCLECHQEKTVQGR
jgi:hypothetical protein